MGIEPVYRSGFAIVVALLGTAAVYLQARGAAQLLGAALIDRPSVAAKVPEAPPPAATIKSERTIRLPVSSPPTALDTSDPLSWPDCEGIQALIVTESKDDPGWSLTTLRWAGEEHGRLRRVGDAVGGKQVAFIGYNPRQLVPAVWLTGEGTACQSPLFRPPAPAPARVPVTDSRIDRRGDGQLRVDRTLADETLQDPKAALRSVRVVPEMKDGAIIGLRLFGIRPKSLLASLGLQNGDRLESINGFSLTSPEKALEAYARLTTASELRVRLNRGGKPVEISVTIV